MGAGFDQAMPSPRNLIIGAIEGYQFPAISQFFTTLRRTSFDGDLVIFHRNIDEPALARIREFGATLIPLPPRGIRNPFTGRRHSGAAALGRILQVITAIIRPFPFTRTLHMALAARFFHIANGRFLAAYDFLRKHPGEYGQVLITDVRDVIFQADPFAGADPTELCTFYEAADCIVRRHDIFYRRWLEAEYGEIETSRWLDNRLACCGLTMGPAQAMLAYLEAMTNELLASRTLEPYHFGLDSAVHNRLLFLNAVPGLKAREIFDRLVATLGTVSSETVSRHIQNGLRNDDGTLVNVIHQYDRHDCCRQLAAVDS